MHVLIVLCRCFLVGREKKQHYILSETIRSMNQQSSDIILNLTVWLKTNRWIVNFLTQKQNGNLRHNLKKKEAGRGEKNV